MPTADSEPPRAVADAPRFPLWVRSIVVFRWVSRCSTRVRRAVFASVRHDATVTADHFVPSAGITVGDFCAYSIVASGTYGRAKTG